MTTNELLLSSRKAFPFICRATSEQKNLALLYMAEELIKSCEDILNANLVDMNAAKGTIGEVMCDRLLLNKQRIKAMADGILEVKELNDPVGRVIESFTRENGLNISKVSVPLGVVAIIYESRPNVTSDAAALCIKSGNACVLRSGKEAHNSACAIVKALRSGLKKANLPEDLITIVEDTSRASANELMTAVGLVDLLIPRGGKGLIKACVENATVPCIETGTGICHIYVDKDADFDKALKIIENAKTSRPSVCNAAEQLIVHKSIASEFLPVLYNSLSSKVDFRTDKEASLILGTECADNSDFCTEFLDYIMGVQVADSLDTAIDIISKNSTHHSDAIITENKESADKFVLCVDSAAVYVNASTRFTDGGEFGLGCEMGISTQKLHARGPMGLCELNTYKYIVRGNGQTR